MGNQDFYHQQDSIFKQYIDNTVCHSKEEKLQQDTKLFQEWVEQSEIKKIKNFYQLREVPAQPFSEENNKNLFEKYLKHQPIIVKDHLESKNKPYAKKRNLSIPEIDLHGFTKEEAIRHLIHFIDQIPSNIKKLRIIHGKGLSTGRKSIIREIVRNWLLFQKNEAGWVKDFSYETPKNGSHGATIVWINKEKYEKY